MNVISILQRLEGSVKLDKFTGNHGPNKLHSINGTIKLEGTDLLFDFKYLEGNNGGVEHSLIASRTLFDGANAHINIDGQDKTDNPHITFRPHQQGLTSRIEFDFVFNSDRYRVDGTIEGI